ncbi:unnamed protein product [Calypogeia fissa]
MQTLEPELYAKHAFPLHRFGKVSSNPVEQANSGLLSIRDFDPFKLLMELWYYIQQQHNDRRSAAMARHEMYCHQASRRHSSNLQSFGQWQVVDDGEHQAKVQTIDQQEEYLVSLSPTIECSLKKGRHKVVRIERGGRATTQRELGPDERVDAHGNLEVQYPLQDDTTLRLPLPIAQTAGRSRQGRARQVTGTSTRRDAGPNIRQNKCSKCHRPGHNI